QPLLGKRAFGAIGNSLDAVCLYALIAGMGASLATGVLTLGGGIEKLGGWASTPMSWTVIGIVIMVSYLISAISGLTNGIKLLSNINTVFYFALVFFILFLCNNRHSQKNKEQSK
nr:BCCT family transporter [Ignavibacteria bacterium]